MDEGLMLCDIGNTSIKIGFGDQHKIIAAYALPVGASMTYDGLGLTLLQILAHAGLGSGQLKICVASSVAPAINPLLVRATERYMGCQTVFVPEDMGIPLKNCYEKPDEVGADRLVGAYAARLLFPEIPSIIIVDFGTAVTFDCVAKDAYMGGLIFPGPASAAAALSIKTAKLPLVNLDMKTEELLPCRSTETSIRHGIVFGFLALTEGLCAKLKQRLQDPVRIVATGGFASSIGRLAPVFDEIIPDLVLDGLRKLYYGERASSRCHQR